MNMNVIKISLLFASTSVLAAPVIVPNAFVANTPAVAADVNENFTTLANGVNTNDANIGTNTANIDTNSTAITALQAIKSYRVEDKNGADIGALLYSGGHFISTVTDKGYVRKIINLADGTQNTNILLFTNTNCMGQAYVQYDGNGHVFENAGSMYYVDKMATATDIIVNSGKSVTGICENTNNVAITSVYPALNNDPVITGATKLEGLQPFVIQVK